MMVSQGKPKSPRSRRVLVIGEDVGSRDTLIEPLRWESYDIRGVASLEEAESFLTLWRPQIVLLDGSPDGAAASWLVSLRRILPHASVLYISDESSTEGIISGLDQGADDYIVKPFVPLELLARIRTHMRIRDLQEQLIYANEKLKELVDTDDLTGLYNMRSLYQRLDFELGRARRFGRGVCVVMMDMDHFKSVNDGHDHLFGSYVLSEFGKIIKANTRNIDIPARYGGDEFLVVLTETGADGARRFCERLRQSVEQTEFRNGTDAIRLTVSIGFAMADPTEVVDAREIVRRADHALYDAKRGGRNRVCFFNDRPENATPKVIPTNVVPIRRSESRKKRRKTG